MSEAYLKVEDVMKTTIFMISGLATVREALIEMREKGVTALIIERRHEGDEFGIVSINEIAERVIAKNRSIDRVNVYEVMDKPILTLSPDMAAKYAIRLLSRLSQNQALVVGNTGAEGLVTQRDLVLKYADADEQ